MVSVGVFFHPQVPDSLTQNIAAASPTSQMKTSREVLMVNIFISGSEKGGKCIAETAQCPAYSAQERYKDARQSLHLCLAASLHTLSEDSHSIEQTGPDHN